MSAFRFDHIAACVLLAVVALASVSLGDDIGVTSVLPDQETGVRRIQIGMRVTLPAAASVESITAYVGGKKQDVRYAIYADSSGEPGVLIAETVAVQSSMNMAWLTIPLTEPESLAPGSYWLSLSLRHDQQYFAHQSGGGQVRYNGNNAVMSGYAPSWGVSTQSHDRRLSMYATCAPIGSGGGPVAHWRLDETSGTTAYDSSGNGHHGTLRNMSASPNWTGGRLGGSLEFDGIDDYIEVASVPNLSGSFTVISWFKVRNVDGDQRIFADDEHNVDGFAVSIGDDGGTGRVRFFNRSVTPVSLDSSNVLSPNTWHFVAAVHDASQKVRRIYVDDALVAEDMGSYGGAWGSDTGPASIGGEVDGTSEAVPKWRLDGNLDDVRLYDRALSAAEIEEIRELATPIYRLIRWTEVQPD